jgi:hypothetical protein
MTIERIESLESAVTLHSKRLDDHAKLHAKHIAADAINSASIAALEKNTEVTTKLTTVMVNLIEALSWATKASIWAIKISKAIMWIGGGIGVLYFGTKAVIAKLMVYL